MWSNFNDSFTAITDHISTQIRQTIPTIQSSFGEQHDDDENIKQQREFETKIELLRNEVIRHRNIAQTYKERWLEAENVCKQTTGNCSKVYDDDVNLLDDDDDEDVIGDDGHHPESIMESKELSSNPDTIAQPEQQQTSTTTKIPKCLNNLRLDSAVQQINRLQNELKKLQTDGEHWRKLAKQKSSIEEAQISELEYLRNELKIYQQKCNDYEEKFKNFNENFQKIEQEYSIELQQLDQLHDEERMKLLKLRDQLIDENQSIKRELNQLKQSITTTENDVDSGKHVDICTQTEQLDENRSLLPVLADSANQTDFEQFSIEHILKVSSKYLNLTEFGHCFEDDNDNDDGDRQKFVEKIVENLCKRLDTMMMMTTTDGNDVDESKMTLHRQQPAVDQMLNHVGDDENNSSNHHCHLMNELEKISKEKNELEQKLNELQAKQQQSTTESVNSDANHAVQSSSSAASTEFSIREEPEGANNTDSDLNINNQDNYQQEEFDNQNRLIKELETKLSTLTAEHDDLCQRYHSSQNENQIFERRFKETEEESVKLQHHLHQIELESDTLRNQLNEIELERNLLRQDLLDQKSQKICQTESMEKLTKELNQYEQQSEQMTKMLNELTEDNSMLKSRLAEKDDELIKLREKSTTEQENQQTNSLENEKLTTELNRLRQHLVQVEENYIGYLKEMEERLEQSQKIIEKYEQMNFDQRELEYQQQIESLRLELESLRKHSYEYEDKIERLQANLINMQSVIEQLEKEHERKIRSLNDEYQKQKQLTERNDDEWRYRLKTMDEHLQQTRQALEAASRLTEQIEQKELLIEQLKREAKNKDQEILKQEKKLKDIEQSQEGKVDKQIIKSLILSYLATPMDKRTDGERLLARFLDFNQDEMLRVGIRIGRDANNKSSDNSSSFTTSFVQFLETESTSSPDKNPANNNGRRLSSSSSSSTSNQQMELARDLNKRLNQQQQQSDLNQSRLVINPFVSPVVPPVISTTTTATYHHHGGGHHSRTPSMHSQQSSTSSSLSDSCNTMIVQNRLLSSSNIDSSSMTMMNIVPPTTTTSNIPEIIRDVMNKDKFI